MWDDLSLAVVIKMPKQQKVTGWCGTFDGFPGDDDMRWMNNNKGVVKGPGFPKEEDLFAEVPKSSLIDGVSGNAPPTEALVSTGFYGEDGEELGKERDEEEEEGEELEGEHRFSQIATGNVSNVTQNARSGLEAFLARNVFKALFNLQTGEYWHTDVLRPAP